MNGVLRGIKSACPTSPARPAVHDRVGARVPGVPREGRGVLRGLLVRIEERHVKSRRPPSFQDRLVNVHRNAPARKAARATTIPYFVTRCERAGFAAE